LINQLHLFAASCGGGFLTLPNWYSYLPAPGGCSNPSITSISDIWLIVLAVTEMLIQLVSLVTICVVIYGGVQMISSQGQPDRTARARSTIINGLIGMTISIAAASMIAYLGGQL